ARLGLQLRSQHQRRGRARLAAARPRRQTVSGQAGAHRTRRRVRVEAAGRRHRTGIRVSSLRRVLGLRLSVWYAAIFAISTVALVAVTYALLASSLAQRDHD